MGPSVFPLTPDFAAEIGDVNLSAPLSEGEFAAIREAFRKYAVVIFADQKLTQDQHMAFARRFGPLVVGSAADRKASEIRVPKGLADISNLDPSGSTWDTNSRKRLFYLGNRLWHTDSSFRRLPGYASLLYARSIAPIGGHTEFADERAAYDALPGKMKARLSGLVAEHCIQYSRARIGFADFNDEDRQRFPPVPQAVVRTLPDTGRMTLYMAAHAGRISGMPDTEARALIDELIEHATQRQFVYMHRWRVHDLVMWDNRCTMHRGTEFDDVRWKRDMQRATVSDIAPSCEQEGISAA